MQFKSVDHALSWSFQVSSCPIVKMSSINSMRGSEGFGGMTPHDMHAQAALVISMADRLLDAHEMAWVIAKFGHGLDRSDGGEDQRRLIEDRLTMAVLASLPTGMHSRRGYSKLILCYFGHSIGQQSIRKDLKCSMDGIPPYRKQVYDTLDLIWDRAMAKLTYGMLEHGLIADDENS